MRKNIIFNLDLEYICMYLQIYVVLLKNKTINYFVCIILMLCEIITIFFWLSINDGREEGNIIPHLLMHFLFNILISNILYIYILTD